MYVEKWHSHYIRYKGLHTGCEHINDGDTFFKTVKVGQANKLRNQHYYTGCLPCLKNTPYEKN